MHGHAISRSSALRLKRSGFDAYCVAGGIEAWRGRGLPLAAKGGKR